MFGGHLTVEYGDAIAIQGAKGGSRFYQRPAHGPIPFHVGQKQGCVSIGIQAIHRIGWHAFKKQVENGHGVIRGKIGQNVDWIATFEVGGLRIDLRFCQKNSNDFQVTFFDGNVQRVVPSARENDGGSFDMIEN